jgi:2-keto-3-deoxy-galactonokinase
MMEHYIAVDWGSTHLRAWHIENDQCVNTLHLPLGVTQLATGEAPAVFARHIAPWRAGPDVPVVMAGMIGSEAGWRSVAYLPCPVSLHDVGARLEEVTENVWIVPGLKLERENEFNVMRGEETQLLGAMSLTSSECYVLPGTHSKWVSVEEGQVTRFDTVMTGELHQLLLHHSLIGKGLAAQHQDETTFLHGLQKGLSADDVVSRLFSTRAARVLGVLPEASVSEALSGLLIGAEVATLSRRYQPKQVTLIASETLSPRYRQAFALLGIAVNECRGEDTFLQGVRRIIDARY